MTEPKDMKMPKVLILIQPFNQNTGGGITLSNLFRGWPKENLAVVCRGHVINSHTETDICKTYYQLGRLEHKWKFPFNIIKRKYYSGILSFEKERIHQTVPEKSNIRVLMLNKFVNPLIKWLGLKNAISKIVLSDQLKTWLKDYEPDLIYAQAQSKETVLFCSKIQSYLNKPMVFHMMDDWLQLEREGLLGKFWYPKVDRDFRKMLGQSALHLSISELMSHEYEQRYGFAFQTFHNPIDVGFWRKGQRNSYIWGKAPTILYAGRVGLGIDASLEMMATAITRLNKELNDSIKFILQVSQKPRWVEKYPCVEHRKFVPYGDLPHKFGEADLLYLPYDFSDKSLSFIKYSMPTKASEYMISGTPILIFSPADTAIVDYASKYKWAKVVTENSTEALVVSLRSLILNQEERERIAKTAVQLAENKHDAHKVRSDFKKTLTSIVNKNSLTPA